LSATPALTSTLDLGGITLTYIPDGEFRAEPALAYPSGHEAMLSDDLDVVDDDGMLVLSIGAVLISTPDRKVLVDTGIGIGIGIGNRTIPLVRPGTARDAFMRGGTLLDELRKLGVQSTDIDAVLLTHLHADHVGWIGNEHADGISTFPNADYLADSSRTAPNPWPVSRRSPRPDTHRDTSPSQSREVVVAR
jgi:glyoxylase-like metal-dependent hydrolase (beta-lactamase superfamily II)